MRFSVILWTFSLLLLYLNGSGMKTVTSGLFVPEYNSGYFCVAFFLVSEGFVALIIARLVTINGPDRWNEKVPPLLKKLLLDESGRWYWETWALILSQAPTLIVFLYMFGNSQREGVSALSIWPGFLSGSAAATFIWWAANAWFYLTYEVPESVLREGYRSIKLGKNAARTMLFPRAWFGLLPPGTPLRIDGMQSTATLESATTILRRGAGLPGRPLTGTRWALLGKIVLWPYSTLLWFLRLVDDAIGLTGYLYSATDREADPERNTKPDRSLYEGHLFAIMSTVVFLTLYLLVWAVAAPVPALWTSVAIFLIVVVGAVIAVTVLFSARSGVAFLKPVTMPQPKSRLWIWKTWIALGLLIFLFLIAGLYFATSPERFPVLATVIIVVTLACWSLAGVAFFADRYRIPVLTAILILTLLPRLTGLYGDHEEHYFSTVAYTPASVVDGSQNLNSTALTPSEIVNARLSAIDMNAADQPLIIVTATGGGLHASAWTSAVLAQLEIRFAQQHESFHNHVLLMSTVSGGSVGLLAYLREINDPAPDWIRMQTVAQCSSLEAVGWGLVYYDIPKDFLPLAPYALPTSSGDGDLDQTALFKDRSWALRKGFARNVNDRYCAAERKNVQAVFSLNGYGGPTPDRCQEDSRSADCRLETRIIENNLTLRKLFPNDSGTRPAFTMNTTSVEQGARFLLANYRVPQYPLDSTAGYPSQSFLDTFGCCKDRVFDLPLATAAQLSATFPYISSATRAPKTADVHSVHFVDGGYYDNDGTASVLEFLRYALTQPEEMQPVDQPLQQRLALYLAAHPMRIVLIEIRNSADPEMQESAENTEALNHGGGMGAVAADWNWFDQVTAPLEGFWGAGHESVTGRNRASLSLLERVFRNQVLIHRIVFDDRNAGEEVGTDPLSWSLTPRQRNEVLTSSCPRNMRGKYDEAWDWFHRERQNWNSDSDLGTQLAPAQASQSNATVPAGATAPVKPGAPGTETPPKR
jgi:hypothetical protein